MGAGVGGSGKGNFIGSVVQQAVGQNQHPGMLGSFPQYQFDNNNPPPNNPYNVDYANYTSSQYPPSQTTPTPNTGSNVSGEAFNTGINSNSDLASIVAGLVTSGVFNQQGGNPYAPQDTIAPSHIPYGQQQGSMFGRHDLMPRNPYGGYQGQSWNPYGNYYTAGPATPANTSNFKPADPNEGLKRLSLATQTQQNQGQKIF
jgi:hypothetical protein